MTYTITAIKEIIAEAANMKNSYFWSAPTSAASRRQYEAKHSHPVVEWEEGGHHYTAEYTVSCSCKNVYARGNYTKDGKKTTLLTIRNSLNRMEQEIEA